MHPPSLHCATPTSWRTSLMAMEVRLDRGTEQSSVILPNEGPWNGIPMRLAHTGHVRAVLKRVGSHSLAQGKKRHVELHRRDKVHVLKLKVVGGVPVRMGEDIP